MKNVCLICLIVFVGLANAQAPIFDPSMVITEYGIVDSPVGEEVDKIIDGDFNTKFLDFELSDGMGFTVDLGGESKTAISIDLTTANDFPVRDPIDYEVSGSNDGVAFVSVATGSVACIPDRFETRNFSFTNNGDYLYYRINFSAPCDPSGGAGFPSIQLAEVQLYEAIAGVNESNVLSKQISINPNPSNGYFKINYSGNNPLKEINIFDITGTLIYNTKLSGTNSTKSIELRSVSSGMYFVNIATETGSTTKKLVIR